MKKFMALSLAAMTALALAGCGSGAGSTTAADTTAAEKTASDKTYIINTDTTFAPFEFENEKGDLVGIDMDILKAVAEDQGFKYEVVPVGFSAATTALESGECDAVIAGMSITDERKEKYDFSDPYFDSGVGMAVLADSDIDSCDKLNGLSVAAKIGTEGCKFAESIADQYGFTVTQYEDSATMYQAVLAGEAAACFEDYPVVGYEITRGLGLKLPTPMEAGNSYGFATMKGENTELNEMFNKGLANIKANGKYQEILDTYIAK